MPNVKISELPQGVPSSSSIFPFVEGNSTFRGYISGITLSNLSAVTLNDIDVLISSSGLSVGKFYKISGVDSSLYGGTEIVLQAITETSLSDVGYGIFYNPQYDQEIAGYGIFTRYMRGTMDNFNGIFNINEPVFSDNGAVATYLASGLLEYQYGDWSNAQNITGTISGATATTEFFSTPSYVSGDTAIWGGKKWMNISTGNTFVDNEIIGIGDGGQNIYPLINIPIYSMVRGSLIITDGVETFTSDVYGNLIGNSGGTGTVNYNTGDISLIFFNVVPDGNYIYASYDIEGIGATTDKYNLDLNWQEIPYNNSDYNLTVDEIKYDYEKDKIIERKDLFNNIVSSDYQIIINFENEDGFGFGNPIKDFQWGNGQTNFGYEVGIYNFSDFGDCSGNFISLGGDNMYSCGNKISTDLGDPPYTHTRLPIIYPGGIYPQTFPMNGQVVSGDSYFGASSTYFTNLYPGLFVLGADNISIDSFIIDGNTGASEGDIELDEYTLNLEFSVPYTIYVKKIYNTSTPSVNHVFIVNSLGTGITRSLETIDVNSDFDSIVNLTGVTTIYYLLISANPGDGYIYKTDLDNMIYQFLSIVDTKTLGDALNDLNENYQNITSIFPAFTTQNRRGVMNNFIQNGYLDCLNSLGGYVWNNRVVQFSYIHNNIFAPDFYSSIFRNALFESSSISDNILSYHCHIDDNQMNNSSKIDLNSLGNVSGDEDSYIDGNILVNESIIDDNVIRNSYISLNNLIFSNINGNDVNDGSSIVSNSISNSSGIMGNHFDNTMVQQNDINSTSIIQNSNFDTVTLEYNNMFNSNFDFIDTPLLNNISIKNIDSKFITIDTDLSSANILFTTIYKSLFTNSDGVTRLGYYNSSDTFVVGNITD